MNVVGAAALFDMDGTLVDSTAVVEELWGGFADRYGIDLPDLLRYAHGRRTADTVAHFLPEGENAVSVVKGLEEAELVRLDAMVEVPGAARVLSQLAHSPVAVVTSAPRELARRRMDAAGIAVPDVIVGAEDVVDGKPSPEGYLRAASLLGVPADRCVVFEDAENGIRAALAASATTVVVGEHRSATTTGLPRLIDYRSLTVDAGTRGITFEIDESASKEGRS